jgi:hypothetical protein
MSNLIFGVGIKRRLPNKIELKKMVEGAMSEYGIGGDGSKFIAKKSEVDNGADWLKSVISQAWFDRDFAKSGGTK